MKRKILTVNLELLLAAVCRDDRPRARMQESIPGASYSPQFVTCDGMPEDARIVDIGANCAFAGQVDLLIESDTFPDVPGGYQLPRMNVQVATYTSYQTYLEMQKKHPTIGDLIDAQRDAPVQADEPKVVAFREFI